MKSFLKIFCATLLALVVCCILIFVFLAGIAGGLMSKQATVIADKTVLTIDLSKKYEERPVKNWQSVVNADVLEETPSFFELIRLIKKAKTDKNISGILLIANNNANGFATSDEIRNALLDFKNSGKFIIAYGDNMTQKAYDIANIADKVYVSPKGVFEWVGFSVNYMFLKGTLDKLEIKPQIFYAGKFKSATEPFRVDKMTEENRLQTSVWLHDIYSDFLYKTSATRKIDTTTLYQLANSGAILTAEDAVTHKLIDGVKYDDEVRGEIKKRLGIDENAKISLVSVDKYATAVGDDKGKGDRIALIYATGNIVDGKGQEDNIGSEPYIELLRKARYDKAVKAIVLRVNSGGGSALASENIWREMALAKKEKPVIVSMGDVAASGGYYISVAADSIFASKSTITGSIGVFGVVPDLSSFFKNKLGVTFDGVATGPLANAGTLNRPMTEQERKLFQTHIEKIYADFKQRVADGRNKDTAYIETIAQGRIWTGLKAKEVGLVDAYGGLQRAIEAAAAKAKLSEYQIREYPKTSSFVERLLGLNKVQASQARLIKEQVGSEYYEVLQQLDKIRAMASGPQTRLPFDFIIH